MILGRWRKALQCGIGRGASKPPVQRGRDAPRREPLRLNRDHRLEALKACATFDSALLARKAGQQQSCQFRSRYEALRHQILPIAVNEIALRT